MIASLVGKILTKSPFSEDVQIYSQQRQNLSRPSFSAQPYISAQGEKKRGQSGAGRGKGKRSKICHITAALINTRLVMSAKTDENLSAPLTPQQMIDLIF